MDTYSFLRQLADSWVLLAMFTFFIGVIFWAFRPGSSETYDAIAQIPLRDGDGHTPSRETKCANCKGCTAPKGASHV